MKETLGNGSKDVDEGKTLNVNEMDIDKMIKEKEKQLEINPNAAIESLDSLSASKKPKEEESLTGMETCEDIKKFGKQRLYCEEKYLLKEGEEKTVNCMKNFCSICCGSDESCVDRCSTTHSFFKGHDPEEMFISVCAFENMGPAFKNFCGSMIVDDNKEEYDKCFTNFCFDCCSNELKITDFNDVEIQKCLNICKKGKSGQKTNTNQKQKIPGSNNPEQKNNKPIELSDEIKKILEKSGGSDQKPKSKKINDTNITKPAANLPKEDDQESKLRELIHTNEKIDNSLKASKEEKPVPIKASSVKEDNFKPIKKKLSIHLDPKLNRKESNKTNN